MAGEGFGGPAQTLRQNGLGPIGRREFIGLSALGSIGLATGCTGEADTAGGQDRLSREILTALDQIAQQAVETEPEAVTWLGLAGRGAPASALARLSPRSQAGFERSRLDRLETLNTLAKLPAAAPQSRLRTHQLAIMGAFERAVAIQSFGFGRVSLSACRPYVIDHRSGAYLDGPRLLLSRHPITSVADADAYLERLNALPETIRDEQRRLEADAYTGILPPRPILSRIAATAAALADLSVDQHPLLLDLANRTEALDGLSAEARQSMLVAATRTLVGPLQAAYRDLAGSAGRLFDQASDLPGVGTFPIGGDYYAALLSADLRRGANTNDLLADMEVRLRSATRRFNAALDALGLASGPIADRRAALAAAHTSEALTAIDLARTLGEEMEALRPRLRQIVARLPDADAVVTLSPDALWAAYPSDVVSYEPAAADGSLSGTLRLHPRSPALSLPTFLPRLHQQGLPGRHLARALAIEDTSQPFLRYFTHIEGFSDAWSAYGLDLAAELARDDDPVGVAFRLQAGLDLASEAILDLGVHGQGWTSDAALTFLREGSGRIDREAIDTLWRISVEPGRAMAAIFGRSVFQALRSRASRALGNDFDPAAFHYTLLSTGPRPFPQVEAELDVWANAQVG